MKLSKVEQETIVLFNEGEADAEVYTHNKNLKKRLENAARKNPKLYRLKATNAYGGVTYTFPKKYLKIVFRDETSEKQQQHCKTQLDRLKTSDE